MAEPRLELQWSHSKVHALSFCTLIILRSINFISVLLCTFWWRISRFLNFVWLHFCFVLGGRENWCGPNKNSLQFGREYGLDRLIICRDEQAQLCTPTLARHQLPHESGFRTLAPQRAVNQCARYLHQVSNRCSPCAYSPKLQMAPDPGSFLPQTLKSHFRSVSNTGWGRRLKGDLVHLFKKLVEPSGISHMHIRSHRTSQHQSLPAFTT